MNCILRFPLLDSNQKVLGYKLACQGERGHGPGDLAALAACVASGWRDASARWDGLLFLEAPAGTLAPEALEAFAPATTVVSVTAAELAQPAVLAAARVLRERGFGVAVRRLPSLRLPVDFAAVVTHQEFDWGRAAAARDLPGSAVAHAQPCLVAAGLASWEEYQASAALGLHAVVAATQVGCARSESRLSAESLLILQLMQMVQSNADVRHIEATLRRDAALAYQLLRYLNSASFGFGVEVQSLRHAVAMMGYGPLYRWLAVLLAGSQNQAGSQVLLQAAVIRGRFTELLGQGMLPRRDAENLFVAGLFSLLDRLVGVPLAQILEKIQLPDAVVQALLTRDGLYGPFLRVAEACEGGAARPDEIADSAFLTVAQTNAAHVAALGWALDLRA